MALMKRWWVWLVMSLLLALPILLNHSRNPNLLQDSDTTALLHAIGERNAPLSWFASDWPLENHFYRPLPTLTFEIDSRLYRNDAAGYGWTNAILCTLCSLGLLWLLAELFRSPLPALAGAAIFTAWTLGWLEQDRVNPGIFAAVAALILIGLYRHSFGFSKFLPACFVTIFLGLELVAPQDSTRQLSIRMMDWLPGRTASVMTAFCLLSMAAYLRFERARNRRLPLATPTATDRPTSTRTSDDRVPAHPWLWFGISLVAAAAALASYEQAVMLPAALLGLAVFLRWRRQLPCWGCHAAFWLMLGGYLLLRHAILPQQLSQYQSQQLRHGPGVAADLLAYIAPYSFQLYYVWIAVLESIWALYAQYMLLLYAGSTAVAAVQSRRNLTVIATGWALSILAFLPMAWLKQFGHYHYWPMALRTILVIGVAKVAWDLISIAASRPALQAPPRPSPAPGSLPHL